MFTVPFWCGHRPVITLERLGVQVRLGTRVTAIDEDGVTVSVGAGDDATEARIPARTVLWGAGVQASSFARKVAAATGASCHSKCPLADVYTVGDC